MIEDRGDYGRSRIVRIRVMRTRGCTTNACFMVVAVWHTREISHVAYFDKQLHARIGVALHHAAQKPHARIVGQKPYDRVALRWYCYCVFYQRTV